MTAKLRVVGICAIAASLHLAGCATSNGGTAANRMEPPVQQQNLACVPNPVASRIPSISPPCAAPGRSYSSDDIAHTGATTGGEALRLLDPAITVHH